MSASMLVPFCETCNRPGDIHGEPGDGRGWDHDFAPITLVEHNRRQRVHERRLASLWHSWGCEDAGDRRLRDITGDRVLALELAGFAAGEAEDYVRERSCFLSSVGDQRERYIAALTPGSRFVSTATGDTYEVLNYNGEVHKVDCRVVDGVHGCPSTLPLGYTFVIAPETLAGRDYRLALVEAVAR